MKVDVVGDAVLYQTDCLDLLRDMKNKGTKVDAIVTDPPYGINFQYNEHDDNEEDWFKLMDEFVPLARAVSSVLVMPCCVIKRLEWWYMRHPPTWLIAWYKGSPGHRSAIGFNDWEPHLVYGKPPKQIHDFFQTPLVIEDNGHPCPKPLAYTTWLVSRFAEKGQTVMDPFMGSGTTGAACQKLGRKFIGVEKDEKYFQISMRRLQEVGQQKQLFDIVKED